ncbi:MAG: 7-cyano-7-deazaguanine synthase [Hyphomicrobiaceae bacterium]
MVDALGKLSGDRWEFTFVRRRSAYPDVPGHLEWDRPSSVILPFSDGMDSRAVATLFHKEQLVLVRLGDKQIDSPEVDGRKQAFTTVPYSVPGRRLPETSGRARGFKFAMLGALAAHLSKTTRVMVPESGQGALGPVLAGHHDGDYRSHPVFMRKMQRLVSALLGSEIVYEFPRLWFTKGQTLRAALDAAPQIPWRETRSCWQPSTQMSLPNNKRQCGFCASCMLRRLSVHAAGESDNPGTYMLEDLSAATLEAGVNPGYDLGKLGEAQQVYAIAGALHLDHLAALSATEEKPRSFYRKVRELAKALGQPEESVLRSVHQMLAQHEAEWRAFLKSLAPSSFIRQRSVVVS